MQTLKGLALPSKIYHSFFPQLPWDVKMDEVTKADTVV